ncbi:hypothetical protein U1Q18_023322 [Sarracenia purpurea var. burkii]
MAAPPLLLPPLPPFAQLILEFFLDRFVSSHESSTSYNHHSKIPGYFPLQQQLNYRPKQVYKNRVDESQRRVKQKIHVLVKHRKPLYGEGELGKAVEHDDHGEERTDEDSAVGFVVGMHFRLDEHR